MKIVGVCGFIGSGKDTLSSILVNEKGYTRLSFADSLKDSISVTFGWDRAMLEGNTPESRQWRESVDEWWSERLSIPNLTPRKVMQIWGTDILRNQFHPDIWLASLENKIRNSKYDRIVISDCRFTNELETICRLGGEIVWVKRGENPAWLKSYLDTGIPPENVHISEYGWTRQEFSHIIENNGTLQEFEDSVKKIF